MKSFVMYIGPIRRDDKQLYFVQREKKKAKKEFCTEGKEQCNQGDEDELDSAADSLQKGHQFFSLNQSSIQIT